MNRALAASTIALLAVGLPAAPAVAHDCPCFPPGEWIQATLPADIAALSPEAAAPVPGGVLIFGRTDEGADLAAALLTLPAPSDLLLGDEAGMETIEFPPIPEAFPSFVSGDASSSDVLVGGNIAMEGASVPFLSFSSDGGLTWTDVDLAGAGLDVLIDGARHGDGYAFSGANDLDDGFHPAVTFWDGESFDPFPQLSGAQGFAITITSGPGDDVLSIGGFTSNKKGKTRPAVFVLDGDGVERSNLPGVRDDFPIDILTSGNDIIVTRQSGRVLHATGPLGKWTSLEDLKGSRILPVTMEPGAPLMAYGPGGASFSFDDGDTWARTALDGIADVGTVKATGITRDGGFWAFSRGEDGLPQLHIADGPGAGVPLEPPMDPLDDFARMMARFFVDDLYESAGGVPTPEFVGEVTSAMHEAFADRGDDQIESDAPDGSARKVAEGFLDRLATAGGSEPTEDFIFRVTVAIQAEYVDRAGASD